MADSKKNAARRAQLEADKLLVRVDELLRREDLTVDQQHQLLTVKRYLTMDPDPQSEETQAALACVEIVVDTAQLDVYQRRYGLASP